jgi:predicted DNA-binding ribbon-helix-helix protein
MPVNRTERDSAVTRNLLRRSIRLSGHVTSIALEPEFWTILELMADQRGQSLTQLIDSIDRSRNRPLASALRLSILDYALRRNA